MELQLIKWKDRYWIKTDTHRESIERSEDESEIEYTNRAFRQFDSYVEARQKLNKQNLEELIKSVNV